MKMISVPYIDQTANGAFTGCESVSAVMLLRYLGYDMQLDEFLDRYLDKEDFEERDGELWGPDPRVAFAGDPRDSEAMGCYAPVIRRSLERILGERFSVTDESGSELKDLAACYIDRDMPVIVWATIDMRDIVTGPSWHLKSTGEIFTWRSNEHCLLMVGYDEEHYIFNDPWEGRGVIAYEKRLFEDRYRKQYSQALGIIRRTED